MVTAANELPPQDLKIHRIHIPASPADTTKFAQMRLAVLRTKVEAFSSIYVDAVRLSAEEWVQRLSTPGRITIVVQGTSTDAKVEAIDHESISGALDTDMKKDWLGTIAILNPTFLANDPTVLPRVPRLAEGVDTGKILCYHLSGMWVHPNARRKGAGKLMMRAVLDIIRDDLHENAPRDATKMIFLQVYEVNAMARALYERLGFVKEEDAEGLEKGRILMSMAM